VAGLCRLRDRSRRTMPDIAHPPRSSLSRVKCTQARWLDAITEPINGTGPRSEPTSYRTEKSALCGAVVHQDSTLVAARSAQKNASACDLLPAQRAIQGTRIPVFGSRRSEVGRTGAETGHLKAEIAVIADIHGKIVTDYDTIGRYLRPIIVCPHFSPLTRNDPPRLHGPRRKDIANSSLQPGPAPWQLGERRRSRLPVVVRPMASPARRPGGRGTKAVVHGGSKPRATEFDRPFPIREIRVIRG
jgi:hypothetical protein